MRKSLILLVVALFLFPFSQSCEKAEAPATQSEEGRNVSINKPIVLAYFPSWSETWTSPGKNSKFREIPKYVNTIFLAFAYPNMRYTKGSYDISGTGLNFPYDGQTFRESARALKNKGIKIILSLGGETYWSDASSGASAKCYDIEYQQIKDFLDDFELAGIDWDYEPAGQISILSERFHVEKFIEFITKSREIMPKGEYLIAAAPSGVGALGGPGPQPAGIDDPDSPFSNANASKYGAMNSNAAKVDAEAATLFGFASSGHFIPVMKAVGDKIDIIAYQGYNCGGANMAGRKVMYDAYAYYAEKYGFTIAAGTHVANEPWGPYYFFDYTILAELSDYIFKGGVDGARKGKNDGIMLWQYLATDDNATHVKKNTGIAFCALSAAILNGLKTVEEALAYDPATAEPEIYTGGAENPSTGGGSGDSGSSGGSGDSGSAGGAGGAGDGGSSGGSGDGGSSGGAGDGGISDGDGGTNTEKLYCGNPAWNEGKTYDKPGAKVYYKGKIWKNSWWTKGDIPGKVWGPWNEENICAGADDGAAEPTPPEPNLHCKYPAWDETAIYAEPGNHVYYKGFIWKNEWWVQGNAPVDEPWKGWVKVVECNE